MARARVAIILAKIQSGHEGRNQGAKGAKAPPPARSKLRKKYKKF